MESASKIIGQNLKKVAIVVLESTFYPGVTEEIMGPILERESGMTCKKDFFVGYSPERTNSGDAEYTHPIIYKIVSGMYKQTLDSLSELYGLVTNVYQAPDIKTAEAAKVILKCPSGPQHCHDERARHDLCMTRHQHG